MLSEDSDPDKRLPAEIEGSRAGCAHTGGQTAQTDHRIDRQFVDLLIEIELIRHRSQNIGE